MTTIQFVVAVAFALMAFVMTANVIVFLYARGVVRSAMDEGARAGSPVDATSTDCDRRAREVLDALLGGGMRSSVRTECRDNGVVMMAHADVSLRSWLPGVVPDWSFTVNASSTRELPPPEDGT
jgi:hypothetical protein